MPIHFNALTPSHVPLLTRWLQQQHVRDFWDDGERDEAAVQAHYFAPQRDARGFIFSVDGQPAGYIQCYPVSAASNFGHWAAPIGETWGIDLLIGEASRTGQGLAPQVIRAFIQTLQAEHPALRRILIDPDSRNGRAIRAYAKAGFADVGTLKNFRIMSLDL